MDFNKPIGEQLGNNLQEKTQYYFRVRSSDGDCGKSPYSNIVS